MNAQGQRYLVVGTGSIARRHIANLKRLDPQGVVGCASASGRALQAGEADSDLVFDDLLAARAWKPRFAVVASPAPLHVQQAGVLLEARIPVLLEKPISSSLVQFANGADILLAHKDRVDVAYNLRHLSSAVAFKETIDSGTLGRIHSVLVDVGQYLPDWRPETDYRQNVSARSSLGGGVLLELSHEFDYLAWIFGAFERVFCVGGNSGRLSIDVEDCVDSILVGGSGLVVNLHMDFLQRSLTRTCKVVAERGTCVWDVARNTVSLHWPEGGNDIIHSNPQADRNEMYEAQLERFSRVASGLEAPMVGVESAWETLRLIEALKRSMQSGSSVMVGDVA